MSREAQVFGFDSTEIAEEVRTRFFDPRKIKIVTGVLGKKDSRFNPRTLNNQGFASDRMDSLRKGIAKDGLNHAILVRLDARGEPNLVAGERRIRSVLALISEDELAEKQIAAGDKNAKRVLVKNPKTGKKEPALKVYGEQGVECKITDETDEREFLRQAIQENTLHESLTDYELLLQCKKMEEAKFSRAEQAETMEVSEAWISQSHTLLSGPQCILQAMEDGKLSRTSAITFIPLVEKGEDVVQRVLKRTLDLTYASADKKEIQAQEMLQTAITEVTAAEAKLRLSQFTGNQESAKKARRAVARAGRSKEKAEKNLDEVADKKKNKKISVETIVQAAKEVEGAAENLVRPQLTKNVRVIGSEIDELLKGDGDAIKFNKKKYDRRDVAIVKGVVDWFLGLNSCEHPFEAISLADE